MQTILEPFEYAAPSTVNEAVSLLDGHGEQVKVLAGGTDLVWQMAKKKVQPELLLDIGNIRELDFIVQTGDTLRIGALTTFSAVETSALIHDKAPILASAAASMGKPQIRTRGTIGGNLANRSPAADSATPLLVLNAHVVMVGKFGERTLPLPEFYREETALRPDELLTEIRVPLHELGAAKGDFIKLGVRKAACLPIVSVSVLLGQEHGDCTWARVAFGAAAPTPIRAYRAEDFLTGTRLTDDVIRQAAEIAADETRPISDVRASKAYRKEVAGVLVRRAIENALGSD
ncbi:MAG: xanthine dehydrogenase family protein subunit M [Pseudomonadota bacterium]